MERAWLIAASASRSVRSWCREPVISCDPEPHAHPRLCQARKGGSTHARVLHPGLPTGVVRKGDDDGGSSPRCAGLDVHKDSVVACVRLAEGGRVERQVETFATTTADLERLSAWLAEPWRHPRRDGGHRRLLETGLGRAVRGDFELVLANAATSRTCRAARPT